MEEVISFWREPDFITKLNSQISNLEIKKIDDERDEVFYIYSLPWPLSPREFHSLRTTTVQKDKITVVQSPLVRKDKAPRKEIVRGAASSMVILEVDPTNPEWIICTSIDQTNFGKIPDWVHARILKFKAKQFSGQIKLLKKLHSK